MMTKIIISIIIGLALGWCLSDDKKPIENEK